MMANFTVSEMILKQSKNPKTPKPQNPIVKIDLMNLMCFVICVVSDQKFLVLAGNLESLLVN